MLEEDTVKVTFRGAVPLAGSAAMVAVGAAGAEDDTEEGEVSVVLAVVVVVVTSSTARAIDARSKRKLMITKILTLSRQVTIFPARSHLFLKFWMVGDMFWRNWLNFASIYILFCVPGGHSTQTD